MTLISLHITDHDNGDNTLLPQLKKKKYLKFKKLGKLKYSETLISKASLPSYNNR